VKWFGEHWGGAVCNETPHVETPVGALCAWCGEAFVEGDQGLFIDNVSEGQGVEANDVPFHRNCFLRQMVGSIGHQLRLCECYGGVLSDPEDMTKRQAANVAADLALRVERLWQRRRERVQ
jgi:hypothetical protein